MHELELLRRIRSVWLDRGIDALARGYGLREHLRGQLEQFFSLLEQVVETGNPAWLDSISREMAELTHAGRLKR
jgi:hypothetical protein